MQEHHYRTWDTVIKALGFIATALSIYFGITYSAKLEMRKAHWTSQNQVFVDICNDAGGMAANVMQPDKFEEEKTLFLKHYYGESILIEDTAVENRMVKLYDFLQGIDIRQMSAGNILTLKEKVFALSNACKNSSETMKPTYLK